MSEVSTGRSAGAPAQAGFSELDGPPITFPPEGQDHGLDPLQRQRVARHQSLPLARRRLPVALAERVARLGAVGKVGLIAVGCGEVGQAAIPVMVDPNSPREALDPAEMVHVPVGRDQVVEVVEFCLIAEDLLDPDRVAIPQARPARVDQDRLTPRGHDQGRGAPHHVDEVEIKILPGIVGPAEDQHQDQRRDGFHRKILHGSWADRPGSSQVAADLETSSASRTRSLARRGP